MKLSIAKLVKGGDVRYAIKRTRTFLGVSYHDYFLDFSYAFIRSKSKAFAMCSVKTIDEARVRLEILVKDLAEVEEADISDLEKIIKDIE